MKFTPLFYEKYSVYFFTFVFCFSARSYLFEKRIDLKHTYYFVWPYFVRTISQFLFSIKKYCIYPYFFYSVMLTHCFVNYLHWPYESTLFYIIICFIFLYLNVRLKTVVVI